MKRPHLTIMHVTLGIAVATLFCAGSRVIPPANAQTIGSSYTSTAPRDCRVSSAGNGVDDSTIRICPGKADLKVLVSEDDLRETVSVGRSRAAAAKEPAAQVGFGPFNSTTPTVEWRALDGKPFADFLSTIVFLTLYLITGEVILATAVAIAGAVAQVIHARIRGQQLSFMTYASVGLVIVLGSATLLTHDPRFVLAKPSIAHFAIGAIMLKRGWMLRYMPPIVTETIPEYVTVAGYAWAALMFALGAGVIAVASTGDLKLWAFYVSVVAIGAKVAAFAVQYVAFRILVINRIRSISA
jgi:intracellular septation protein